MTARTPTGAVMPHVMSCPHGESEVVRLRLLMLAGPETTLLECCADCVPAMEALADECARDMCGITLADAIEYGLAIRVPA